MLDERQRLFCRLVAVEGMRGATAYAQVYGCKANSAATGAVRMMKNAKVRAELERLRGRQREVREVGGIWSKVERMERLQEWAQRCVEAGDVGTAVNCVRELNKMDGAYEAEKVEVAAEVCTFAALLGRIKSEGARE